MCRLNETLIAVLVLSCMLLGCQQMIPKDTQSLLVPGFQRSEVFGLLAGFGTTFAALPDLIVMLRRRSSKGMNPRMAAIIGMFQILWVYYGLLIVSRPVVGLECDRGVHQFSECRRVPLFRPHGKSAARKLA